MSNNKQSSSIDAIMKFMKENGYFIGNDLYQFFNQAKAMHKEEIIEAFDEGQEYEYQYHINSTPKFDSETYYNETFGGNNEQQ